MRKAAALVPAAMLAANLLAGCAAPHTPDVVESRPSPIPADGTFEQVRHNLGDLGGLTLQQTVKFQQDGRRVYVFNLTNTPVNVDEIKLAVGFFATLGKDGQPSPLTIYTDDNDIRKPIAVTAVPRPQPEDESDIVIVPEGTDMPPGIGIAGPAATRLFDGQSISVVQANDNVGTVTEICQFTVAVTSSRDSGESLDPKHTDIDNHGAQETVCNRDAQAIVAAANGEPYDQYSSEHQAGPGPYVTISGVPYHIDDAPVSAAQYQEMAQVFSGQH